MTSRNITLAKFLKINEHSNHQCKCIISNNTTMSTSFPSTVKRKSVPTDTYESNYLRGKEARRNILTTPLSASSLSTPAAFYHKMMSCYSTRRRGTSFFSHSNLLIVGLILILTVCNDFVEGALRNVNLIIEPPAVRRGQHAILRCMYDLEGAPLYSAKFYRGQLEFYRYTPGEFPNTKVFPFPGIHVDVTSSNATQVLIRNVGFGLSGNFSCEVTADAPLFSTATAVGTMQVVELPDKRPLLFTEHARYEPGDILRANCSTPPSRPKAELKLTINNMVVNNAETLYIRTIDNLIASRISLKLQLQGIHFSSVNPSVYGHNVYGMNTVHGGGLVLRCTATIAELYQEYKEIELGTPQKDPVPARVTLSSGSTVRNFLSFLSSGSTKIPSLDISKQFILIIFWQYSNLEYLLKQLFSLLEILLRYKLTYLWRKRFQNICEHLCFISQR